MTLKGDEREGGHEMRLFWISCYMSSNEIPGTNNRRMAASRCRAAPSSGAAPRRSTPARTLR